MSRLATSFVLGYHGCDKLVAERAVREGAAILASDNDYDWLGPGVYFWEADPKRALQWANWKAKQGRYTQPAVIGAVIDLRNCLDLMSQEDIELIRAAYESFARQREIANLPIPENKNPKGVQNGDRVLRYLDCAVIRHLHKMMEDPARSDPAVEPFDTVRGMFAEGGEAFPGSGFYRKSHVQIAVRNPSCVKGIFYPLEGN